MACSATPGGKGNEQGRGGGKREGRKGSEEGERERKGTGKKVLAQLSPSESSGPAVKRGSPCGEPIAVALPSDTTFLAAISLKELQNCQNATVNVLLNMHSTFVVWCQIPLLVIINGRGKMDQIWSRCRKRD